MGDYIDKIARGKPEAKGLRAIIKFLKAKEGKATEAELNEAMPAARTTTCGRLTKLEHRGLIERPKITVDGHRTTLNQIILKEDAIPPDDPPRE